MVTDEKTIELAVYAVKKIIQAHTNLENRITRSVMSIQRLLEQNWTLQSIRLELDRMAALYPDQVKKAYDIDGLLAKKEQAMNLIQSGQLYFHRLLRVSSAPVRIIQEKSGTMKRISTPYVLQIKRKFTMDELIHFFYESCCIAGNDHIRKQDEGKFKYLLSVYELDELLFAIDASVAIRHEQQQMPVKNAFDLEQYIEDAKRMIAYKRNLFVQEQLQWTTEAEG